MLRECAKTIKAREERVKARDNNNDNNNDDDDVLWNLTLEEEST